MKWNIIKAEWPYKEPEFWSACNWVHRFINWRGGMYTPDEQNCICQKCHTWWAKWTHNRHDEEFPPMYRTEMIKHEGCTEVKEDVVNDPFWLVHAYDKFLYRNPAYVKEGSTRWLNGKGVALKRERYPDL